MLVWRAPGPWLCPCAALRPEAWGAGLLIPNYPAPVVAPSVTRRIHLGFPRPHVEPPGYPIDPRSSNANGIASPGIEPGSPVRAPTV